MSDIVERLNGTYRIPITDGYGAAGGEEPDNPKEFVRTFPTTPIQMEAAAEITRLRADLAHQKQCYEQLDADYQELIPAYQAELQRIITMIDHAASEYNVLANDNIHPDKNRAIRDALFSVSAAIKGGNPS